MMISLMTRVVAADGVGEVVNRVLEVVANFLEHSYIFNMSMDICLYSWEGPCD